MQRLLEILAYWVVFGLPLLLCWRIYKLFCAKNKPVRFYVGGVILYLAIAIWIPFALMRRILDMNISVFPFLTAHLIGAFTGAKLRRSATRTSV